MRTDGGSNFYTNPHFTFCRPLFRVLFLSLPPIFSLPSLSLSLREHPSSPSFSRGVEEFFELTPTCSTTVRFVLLRTKDPKWRLVRRSFFSLLRGLSTLSHLARVCVS